MFDRPQFVNLSVSSNKKKLKFKIYRLAKYKTFSRYRFSYINHIKGVIIHGVYMSQEGGGDLRNYKTNTCMHRSTSSYCKRTLLRLLSSEICRNPIVQAVLITFSLLDRVNIRACSIKNSTAYFYRCGGRGNGLCDLKENIPKCVRRPLAIDTT